MNPKLREQFERLGLRLAELDANLSDTQVLADISRYRGLAREQAEVAQVVQQFRQYQKREHELADSRAMLEDPELGELAREEVAAAQADLETLQADLQASLLPRDPDDAHHRILNTFVGAYDEIFLRHLRAAFFAVFGNFNFFCRRRIANENHTP
jgi:peptide chain release factor 1